MSLQSVAHNSKPEEFCSALFLSSSAEEKGPVEGEDSLDELGRDEQEYVRRRLRDELGREPSEEEVKEWLRRHTEGY